MATSMHSGYYSTFYYHETTQVCRAETWESAKGNITESTSLIKPGKEAEKGTIESILLLFKWQAIAHDV